MMNPHQLREREIMTQNQSMTPQLNTHNFYFSFFSKKSMEARAV